MKDNNQPTRKEQLRITRSCRQQLRLIHQNNIQLDRYRINEIKKLDDLLGRLKRLWMI